MSQFESLGLPLIHAGKVREMYVPPDGDVLTVATGDISAFDHILPTPIPDKEAVPTQLSLWWFERLRDLVSDHVVSVDVSDVVRGRSIIVEKLDTVLVERVVRGYLTGSDWAECQRSRTVCGVPLPNGLHDGDKLLAPIFTPAVKAQLGEHDENVDLATITHPHDGELATRLHDLTLGVYVRIKRIVVRRGIILADIRFELGRRNDGTLVLADEVLIPDSLWFWDTELWRSGESLPSFNRQYVRDRLAEQSGWDQETTSPELPVEAVEATHTRYVEAYGYLTG